MMYYSSPSILYKRKVCSQVGFAYFCYNCLVNIIGQGSNNYSFQVNDATVALINESFRVEELKSRRYTFDQTC